MSIAVGFETKEGVVLCADRQMTDADAGLKFEGSKLFWFSGGGKKKPHDIAFAYCGPAEMARTLFRGVIAGLRSALEDASEPDLLNREYFRQALLSIFKSKDAKGMQSLIVLQHNQSCFFFKTKGERVAIGGTEYIGGGDSSVLRYFTDVAIHTRMTSDDAIAAGTYMVMLANRYVDGCGLGVNGISLEVGHTVRIVGKADVAKYSKRFAKFERKMEKEFFAGQ
jgi:hypothetical protein